MYESNSVKQEMISTKPNRLITVCIILLFVTLVSVVFFFVINSTNYYHYDVLKEINQQCPSFERLDSINRISNDSFEYICEDEIRTLKFTIR